MEDCPNYFMAALKVLGALGLLIYGMRMMSEALQKMVGPQLRHVLARMTSNRLTGMLTGTAVTCAVQSSSATTVMTVSFVSAGLLTLGQAISVIMGANIGTTLTAWIMSLGYNVDLTAVVFPAFFVGMILIYKKQHRYVGDLLFGVAFLFLSLVMLSTTGHELDLEHNEAVVRFFASFDTGSHWTILIFLGIGTLITCLVQSSAAVMAITILLCSTGVLPIYLGIALVMGENIGTTATANLAALGAGTKAKIREMLRIVGELESIGDSCRNMARTLCRQEELDLAFNNDNREQMRSMMDLCDAALDQMEQALNARRSTLDTRETYRIEKDINQMRQQLRTSNIAAVSEQQYDYAVGTLFDDFIGECEKLGNYVVNVVQARTT